MNERLTSVGAANVASNGDGAASNGNGAASNGNGANGNCLLGPSSLATTFVVATTWFDDRIPVVTVTGELDLGTASILEEALLELADDAVIVDLARCGFIDLRGLRVLLAASERLERSNRLLPLVVRDPILLRIFNVTRVCDRFRIYPSLARAAEATDGG